jgi:hypothetical protein
MSDITRIREDLARWREHGKMFGFPLDTSYLLNLIEDLTDELEQVKKRADECHTALHWNDPPL